MNPIIEDIVRERMRRMQNDAELRRMTRLRQRRTQGRHGSAGSAENTPK